MMEWYAFYTASTLLFKGAEPMEMGEDHHASQIFPPPAQTIVGALRTTILLQNGISFETYYRGLAPPEILSAIGEAGNPAPFDVSGPLFRVDAKIFAPAPYSWFIEKTESRKNKVRIFKAQPMASPLLKAEDQRLFWIKDGRGDMVSLGGSWIYLEDLFSSSKEMEIFSPDYFFATESRTGIALHRNRSVRKGHLYTFAHVRLKPEVALLFGTDMALPLSEKGFMKLGAEQRFGRYEKARPPSFSTQDSGIYLSLSLVEGTDEANQSIIATGKIQYIGGWDLKKGFHKPMKGYFPPGSVFSDKIQSNFIQI
jgi:CRISPR-associated protein Cmr3